MLQQSQLHFCMKRITAILWPLTRAAVKLLLFQDNDLSYIRPIQPVITIKITHTIHSFSVSSSTDEG